MHILVRMMWSANLHVDEGEHKYRRHVAAPAMAFGFIVIPLVVAVALARAGAVSQGSVSCDSSDGTEQGHEDDID